jgi:SAM-dependent methyltransferase
MIGRRIAAAASIAGFVLIGMEARGAEVAKPAEEAKPPEEARSPGDAAIEDLRTEAAALRSFVKTPLAGSFLDAVGLLPAIPTRHFLRNKERTHYYTTAEADKLEASARQALESVELDGVFYYTTRYGTPLAYARPLDLIAGAGLGDLSGKRVLDFGYGTIGHLKLMAAMGAEATGVEVDPMLQILYSQPGDQGPMPRVKGTAGKEGTVRLVHGQFPADAQVVKEVGEGYDLFLSKNVLKNGYIHPAQPVDPRRLVHLGVDDAAFVKQVARILRPGGLAMIYNLHPPEAPPGKPYIPWADGRCPFARALWEGAGLRVLAFDVDDSAAVRAMALALGWGKTMDPEKDLFATYTLVAKPTSP